MCKIFRYSSAVFSMAVLFALQGCGLFGGKGEDFGQLVGVPGREYDGMPTPYGMVRIPAGTFHMGQADEDPVATQVSFNKQITIGAFFMDDTEITNNEYRQFIYELQEGEGEYGFLVGKGANFVMDELYPDTTVWQRNYTHHMGDPLVTYYYSHPAFDNYPVVGIDWEAAQIFCKWRTSYLNNYRESNGMFVMPNFRLPSEAEWEYAARAGRDMAKYPWGGPYIRNSKGCMLANFKPGRGNYFDDGFAYTAPVASYFANDYGLYDMSGNVGEWCEDAWNPAATAIVWDLNPTYNDPNEPQKVVRGGSWKDISYFLQTGTRGYEHRDSTTAYTGFRCAMTYIGRSAGNEFN